MAHRSAAHFAAIQLADFSIICCTKEEWLVYGRLAPFQGTFAAVLDALCVPLPCPISRLLAALQMVHYIELLGLCAGVSINYRVMGFVCGHSSHSAPRDTTGHSVWSSSVVGADH